MDRRGFVTSTALGAIASLARENAGAEEKTSGSWEGVDHRFGPLMHQATICLPDDPHKSLVGERGDLRYDYEEGSFSYAVFPLVLEFSLLGMEKDHVAAQRLDSPEVPIVHTVLERPGARLALTAFATRLEAEGRVDTVLLEIQASGSSPVDVVPTLVVKTRRAVVAEGAALRFEDTRAAVAVADGPLTLVDATECARVFALPHGVAAPGAPLRHIVRVPREGQAVDTLLGAAASPAALLEAARGQWPAGGSFGASVSWRLPATPGRFLVSSARNILQAREVRDGPPHLSGGPDLLPRIVGGGRALHPRGGPLSGLRRRGAARSRNNLGAPGRATARSSPAAGGSTGRTPASPCSRWSARPS